MKNLIKVMVIFLGGVLLVNLVYAQQEQIQKNLPKNGQALADKMQAVQEVQKLDKLSGDELVGLLKNAKTEKQAMAIAKVLIAKKYESESVKSKLVEILKGDSEYKVKAAAKVLENIGKRDDKVIKQLKDIMDSRDNGFSTKLAAGKAFIRVAHNDSLLKLLQSEGFMHHMVLNSSRSDRNLRVPLINELLRRKCTEAIPGIKKILGYSDMMDFGEDRGLKEKFENALVTAFTEMTNPDEWVSFLSTRHVSYNVKEKIILELGKRGYGKAAPLIENALEDRGIGVRKAAVDALRSIKPDNSVALLVMVLKDDKSLIVRKAAVDALRSLKPDNLVPLLVMVLKDDKSLIVRKAAVDALRSLKQDNLGLLLFEKLKGENIYIDILDQMSLMLKDKGISGLYTLIKALRDKDTDIRKNAAYILGKERIGGKHGVKALVLTLLKDKNVNVQEMAVWALAQYQDSYATSAIIYALKNMPEPLKKKAVEMLFESKDERALPALMEVFKSSKYPLSVRQQILQGFAKSDNEKIIDEVIDVFKANPADPVNSDVQEVLVKKGSTVVNKLVDILNAEPGKIDSMSLKNTVEVLGGIGHIDAVPVLINYLEWKDAARDSYRHRSLRTDRSELIREAAFNALSKIKDDKAIPVFIQALKTEDEAAYKYLIKLLVQRNRSAVGLLIRASFKATWKDKSLSRIGRGAIQALGKIKDSRAVPGLIELFGHRFNSEAVRLDAINAVGLIKDKRAAYDLTYVLELDSDMRNTAEIRAKAAWALGEIKDEGAILSLTNALLDPFALVRENARNALEKFDVSQIMGGEK